MSIEIPQYAIGILAYGSLVDDPGVEIAPDIVCRIPCKTPFPVEYRRKSGSRNDAPTLIPTEDGAPVNAFILVLKEGISEADAASRLWRRETRQEGSGKPYVRPKRITENTVTVEEVKNFNGVATVLYTKIEPNMGGAFSPKDLAAYAIASALARADADGKDGITYLENNINNSIITPATEAYVAQILAMTGASNLPEAKALLDKRRAGQLPPTINPSADPAGPALKA